MVGPYFEEIYRGHDCCKDYTNPKRNLTIQPYRSVIGPRDSLRLWAKGFHLDCEQNCLSWELISGGGSLQNEYGDENVYYSPAYNAECENNATIALICNGFVTAWAYVAINMYTPKWPAYIVFHPTPKLFDYSGPPDNPLVEITTRPMPGSPRTWLEEWYCSTYFCDGTRHKHFACTNQQWIWQRDSPDSEWYKWGSTMMPPFNEMFNDRTHFGWKLTQGMSKTIDIRSARMKTAGCCPKRLLPGG